MDISVNEVVCTDGPVGSSTCVILNPVTRRVTHVVVKETWFPHVERLVPVELVTESTPHQIHLRCTTEDLADLDSFVETEFIQSEDPFHIYDMEEYRMWPYVLPEDEVMPIEYEWVPHGELAIHRGAHVRAQDGHVGRVDEFLVNIADGHITHLVLFEGHLWGQKDVTIPVSEINRIEEDTVHLKLDKASVEALPTIPVQRQDDRERTSARGGVLFGGKAAHPARDRLPGRGCAGLSPSTVVFCTHEGNIFPAASSGLY